MGIDDSCKDGIADAKKDSASRFGSDCSYHVDMRSSVDSRLAQTEHTAVPHQFNWAVELYDSGAYEGNGYGKGKANQQRPVTDGRVSQTEKTQEPQAKILGYNQDRTQVSDNAAFKHDGRVVRVENSWQLEHLKIEKGMTVQLKPGVHYKIHKGLQLPEGAAIIGDKNNPPSIDYVGSTVGKNGKNTWPTCITVNGANALVDGVKVECSGMTMGKFGGARGIFANEGADNLTVRNCNAGKIDSFVMLNGADNVTIDHCFAPVVNSYFLWNEKTSKNATLSNSRCDDSVLEWTVRSYGGLEVENCSITNVSNGVVKKGALTFCQGSGTVENSTIVGGMRIGPLNKMVHGAEYINPKTLQIREHLTPQQFAKAQTIYDEVSSLSVSNSHIEGWVQLNQNAKNVVFKNNSIHRPTAADGSFVVFSESVKIYSGVRKPAQALFIDNRFSGPVDNVLSNPSHAAVHLGRGNTFNGRPVRQV